MNEIKIEAKIEEKDLYHFLLHFAYRRLPGYVSIFFSVVCLIAFPFSLQTEDTFLSVLLIIGGLMYTVFTPLSLKLKAKQQVMLNTVYKEPFTFVFSEEALSVKQGTNKFNYQWVDFYKIEETKKVVLFYVSRKIAFILPKRTFLEEESEIFSILSEKVSKKHLKLAK